MGKVLNRITKKTSNQRGFLWHTENWELKWVWRAKSFSRQAFESKSRGSHQISVWTVLHKLQEYLPSMRYLTMRPASCQLRFYFRCPDVRKRTSCRTVFFLSRWQITAPLGPAFCKHSPLHLILKKCNNHSRDFKTPSKCILFSNCVHHHRLVRKSIWTQQHFSFRQRNRLVKTLGRRCRARHKGLEL